MIFSSGVVELTIQKQLANELLINTNDELLRRIQQHRVAFHKFWNHPDCTPQQLCDEMGTDAGLFFQLASLNIAHINTVCTLLGVPLSDYIDSTDYLPLLPVHHNSDGTITIG
jgi:hypothetical protein